ncbi:MAG TPA: terminase TerL endonuclease subunit, partial [Chloroflexota bacterium]|nr:terminase TerL endonuclease subunit [Chloroflexota bacterium]
LHLDVWTQQDTRWMPIDKWNECAGFQIDAMSPRELRDEMEARLEGELCYIGLDLSKRIDLTAEVKVFPPSEKFKKWIVIPRFWVPEGCVEKRAKEDRVPYDLWIREGYITATEGNVVDFDIVEAQVLKDWARYKVPDVAYDEWNAVQISNSLAKKGVEMTVFGQGFASMSEPTNRLMELVLNRELAHLDNPVLRWNASNLVVKQDEAGNFKPNKDKSSEKIDGIVALIMGLGRAIANPEASDEWDGSVMSI